MRFKLYRAATVDFNKMGQFFAKKTAFGGGRKESTRHELLCLCSFSDVTVVTRKPKYSCLEPWKEYQNSQDDTRVSFDVMDMGLCI